MSKLAFVFPGQGSQHVEMLGELAKKNPIIQTTFAEASEILGYDLWNLTQVGPVEALGKTEVTEPALLTASVAMWRLWQSKSGLSPSFMVVTMRFSSLNSWAMFQIHRGAPFAPYSFEARARNGTSSTSHGMYGNGFPATLR